MYKSIGLTILLLGTMAVSAQSTPQIVARVAKKNQTANIPVTTVFTPNRGGLFRLSAYSTEIVPVAGSSEQWSINLYWTDDQGPQSDTQLLQGAAGGFGSAGWQSGAVAIFEAAAGQPVSYSVTLYPGTESGGTYSLYFIIERLE